MKSLWNSHPNISFSMQLIFIVSFVLLLTTGALLATQNPTLAK